jgi:hypothetical protein
MTSKTSFKTRRCAGWNSAKESLVSPRWSMDSSFNLRLFVLASNPALSSGEIDPRWDDASIASRQRRTSSASLLTTATGVRFFEAIAIFSSHF